MIKIQILDYGLGNIKSLHSAVNFLGYKPIIDSVIRKKNEIDLLIIPGVGSFGFAIDLLKKKNLIYQIQNYAYSGAKMLGICLGMQILFNKSEESEHVDGLKLIDGVVKKLPLLLEKSRLPNINWSKIKLNEKNPIDFLNTDNIKFKDFYFLHSYYCKCYDINNVIAYASFDNFDFCSIIKKKNIFGFQFHPEKSRLQGLDLIKNIINF
jgi:glutamine amidotransferase